MAALMYPDYPPDITPEQHEFILSEIQNWSILNGLAVRPSAAFVSPDVDPSGSLAVTAPVTMFPSLFPRRCFDEARSIQTAYNELYATIARDRDWLSKIVEELIDVDDFIAKLWNVHLEVEKLGYIQDVSLGLFRSDYMVHTDPEVCEAKPTIKQVEFNTIASSFGGLSTKVSNLHAYLHLSSAYPPNQGLGDASSLPYNSSIELLGRGLAVAHHAYGPSKSSPQRPICILFVVQSQETNTFDQLALSANLWETHKIRVFRLPFSQTLARTVVSPTNRILTYTPRHSPSTRFEVSLIYFRAGYSPADYPSPDSWIARLHLERSMAIKCPSILTHLAGSKKIQQELATPNSPHLTRFLSSTTSQSMIERIRQTFAAIFPMDDSAAGQTATKTVTDKNAVAGYVLKPQREGGGNNIYGSKIPDFLKSLGDDKGKWRGHILMELIKPPILRNTIFRNGECQSGKVIGELGVYGVCLWRNGAKDGGGKRGNESGKGEILKNWEAGFLLRTKGSASEEGGVAAGFGAVDSPCLIDV